MRANGWTWIAGLGLALALACGAAPDGRGQGVVQSVDPQARQVSIDHGDIPGVMKAMTMTFEVAPGIPLEGLEAGAEVDFRVEEQRGVYTLMELTRRSP
jgi:Cu/Ag efflux protein CusF